MLHVQSHEVSTMLSKIEYGYLKDLCSQLHNLENIVGRLFCVLAQVHVPVQVIYVYVAVRFKCCDWFSNYVLSFVQWCALANHRVQVRWLLRAEWVFSCCSTRWWHTRSPFPIPRREEKR